MSSRGRYGALCKPAVSAADAAVLADRAGADRRTAPPRAGAMALRRRKRMMAEGDVEGEADAGGAANKLLRHPRRHCLLQAKRIPARSTRCWVIPTKRSRC